MQRSESRFWCLWPLLTGRQLARRRRSGRLLVLAPASVRKRPADGVEVDVAALVHLNECVGMSCVRYGDAVKPAGAYANVGDYVVVACCYRRSTAPGPERVKAPGPFYKLDAKVAVLTMKERIRSKR